METKRKEKLKRILAIFFLAEPERIVDRDYRTTRWYGDNSKGTFNETGIKPGVIVDQYIDNLSEELLEEYIIFRKLLLSNKNCSKIRRRIRCLATLDSKRRA